MAIQSEEVLDRLDEMGLRIQELIMEGQRALVARPEDVLGPYRAGRGLQGRGGKGRRERVSASASEGQGLGVGLEGRVERERERLEGMERMEGLDRGRLLRLKSRRSLPVVGVTM